MKNPLDEVDQEKFSLDLLIYGAAVLRVTKEDKLVHQPYNEFINEVQKENPPIR